MLIHPKVTSLNGTVSVSLTASFTGALTDAGDKAKITAYGDPQVNLGGHFVDPDDNAFVFDMGSRELYVGITTQMSGYTANFMKNLPASLPGKPPVAQGSLDCVVSDPARAAQLWVDAIISGITDSVTALRAKDTPLTSIPDVNI